MTKDFDIWNTQKKEIHSSAESKFYRAREVWWCHLGVNVGFEQDGTGSDHQRPVLIIRGFSKDVCLVIPLTTSQKNNKYHIPLGEIDNKKAFAIISQIKLIDVKRLINRLAILDKETFDRIKKAIRDLI